MEQEEQYFYYSPISTIIYFIVFTSLPLLLVSLTIVMLKTKDTTFYAIIPIFLFLIVYQYTFYAIKSLIALLLHKPAIVLSTVYYKDKYFGKKIEWQNIKEISRGYDSSIRSYMIFKVNTPSEIYRQFSDPIYRMIYVLSAKIIGCNFFTLIDQVKGKNADIIKAVREYHDKCVNAVRVHPNLSTEIG